MYAHAKFQDGTIHNKKVTREEEELFDQPWYKIKVAGAVVVRPSDSMMTEDGIGLTGKLSGHLTILLKLLKPTFDTR